MVNQKVIAANDTTLYAAPSSYNAATGAMQSGTAISLSGSNNTVIAAPGSSIQSFSDNNIVTQNFDPTQANAFLLSNQQDLLRGHTVGRASALFSSPSVEQTLFSSPTIQQALFSNTSVQSALFANPTIQQALFALPSVQSALFGNASTQSALFGNTTTQSALFALPSVQNNASSPTARRAQQALVRQPDGCRRRCTPIRR